MRYVVICSLIAFLSLGASLARNASAATSTITVTATVLSKNQCRFLSASTSLDFGLLDPLNPVDVSASTTINFRCQGADPIAIYQITHDDGLYASGPGSLRMQNTLDAAQHIPYTVSLTPTVGTAPKLVTQTLTIDGNILGPDYQFAAVGVYNDTLTLSILP